MRWPSMRSAGPGASREGDHAAAVWALTNPDGFFWPVFPLFLWGIGVVMNAWDVYRGGEFNEAEIRREMERYRGRR